MNIAVSYLKTAWRVLWRNRFTTLINVLGLSVGIASCLLIWMYVQNELSYDQHQSKKDRIYRITSDLLLSGNTDRNGMSSFMLSPTLKNDYPEVEEAIRLMPVHKQTLWYEGQPYQFEDNFMTDAAFFHLFDYDFVEGDPQTALKEPRSVVITDETAKKIFGTETGVMGKMLQYARQSYKITGVVRQVKNTSHIEFNTLLSLNSISPQLEERLKGDWFYMAQSNYVLFKKAGDAIGFEKKLDQLRDTYIVPWLKQVNASGHISFRMQPLTDIHLHSDYTFEYARTGRSAYIYIFSVVAIFILLIACINYMNLATATASRRAKEIGIRKTIGASRLQLFFQFITESLLTVLAAVIIGLCLVEILLPFFNSLTEKTLSIHYNPALLGYVLLMVLLVGFVAGIYPAIYLARMQTVEVLKGQRLPGSYSVWIRKSLVVLQFVVSVTLIISTLVVYGQMHYMKNKDMGFDKEQVLVLTVPTADTSFMNRYEAIQQELAACPDVVKVAGTSSVPGIPSGKIIQFVETPEHKVEERLMDMMLVDYGFLDIMKMQLVAGRNFSKEFGMDDTGAFIVNEAALKAFGWKDPFKFNISNGLGYNGKIVGVVKDFNNGSLHDPIVPLVMMVQSRVNGYLLLKIRSGAAANAIPFIERVWKQYSHRYPMEYVFLDDHFNSLYHAEEKMLQVFSYFSLLTILISCLGLYGLVTFSLEQRVKEIGIRKVMGASLRNIIWIIGKDFMLLVLVAMFIAFPLAWYFMNHWLQDFAFRVSLGATEFLLAAVIATAIAQFTIAFKTYYTASQNPVKSLRYE